MTDPKEEERSPADSTEETAAQPQQTNDDEGPGWLPAILAATALLGIIGFIVCAFSTWVLFQKRTEFAIRTLKGDYIAQLEQSLLDPESKAASMKEINTLISDLEGGKYENWQAAAIMQRLQRTPVFQWGEMQAIEAYLRNSTNDALSSEVRDDGLKQLGRLQRGVEIGRVTSFDFQDILKPVREPSSTSPTGSELVRPLQAASVEDVIRRAKTLTDRLEIPDQSFADIRIEDILRREIEQGGSAGGY